MATLDNLSFTADPWRLELSVGAADAEGWRSGGLRLLRGPEHAELLAVPIALYGEELATLVDLLRKLADGRVERLDHEPLEPSFLLRARRLGDGRLEMAWFVDQGQAESGTSTDTGLGVLMQTDAGALERFADDLAVEAG
jgi:hypothetical protein